MSIKEEALTMKPIEKIHLIDELLLSLDIPNKDIDKMWEEEVENRVSAYDNGLMKSIPAQDVFAKYKTI